MWFIRLLASTALGGWRGLADAFGHGLVSFSLPEKAAAVSVETRESLLGKEHSEAHEKTHSKEGAGAATDQ
ncbi:hypothetical protein D187_008150 [Cystobacter fuscus DSM 2262]|uniref:Uncharacterized protein n=1 Tax=Cystobacter fuscus (strain ATCC 25194 / DSM 2262 / NBRC 100088 / M29) TaxID=1242864 RepID=S9NUL4_CYSF2|nr:hypothetical protein D187_008150 [Cystobacter fuscus DSM 2262]